VDLRREGFEDGSYVNAHLEGGAEERVEILDRVRGGETFGREAHVGCCLLEKRDHVIEVARSRER